MHIHCIKHQSIREIYIMALNKSRTVYSGETICVNYKYINLRLYLRTYNILFYVILKRHCVNCIKSNFYDGL